MVIFLVLKKQRGKYDNKNIFIISLILNLFLSINLQSVSANSVQSKLCSTITKVCVSNVTNEQTVKDEELLQACKDCCIAPQATAPHGINVRACRSRCQKSCEKAYKKVTSKKNN